MLFRFKTSKLSDSLKLAQFLEKEGIEYEVAMDVTVGVDGTTLEANNTTAPKEEPKPVIDTNRTIQPITGRDPDPLWRPANHDNKKCLDKENCKHVTHYGAMPVED